MDATFSGFAQRKNMDPLTPASETNVENLLPATEKKEQRARESDWENEGGSVRDEEKRAAKASHNRQPGQ
jgi:hypothetical protein